MPELVSDLDKAAQLLKIQQIPLIFGKIKEACELFYGVGLHLIDHPVNGLATDIRKIDDLIRSGELAHEKWLVTTYNEKTVPQALAQAWSIANAKLNPSGPVLTPPVTTTGTDPAPAPAADNVIPFPPPAADTPPVQEGAPTE
jgi:hypothetical protein